MDDLRISTRFAPVPAAKSLASDAYNRYKLVAVHLAEGALLRRHGGLKSGTSNLGKKDTAFATELMMSQFCKIAIEGQRGYGKLTKPLTNPRIATVDDIEAARQINEFLTAFGNCSSETAIGNKKFADRTQLFRTAHGLYALAVIINDVLRGHTTLEKAVSGLSAIDWTWKNAQFRAGIGRRVDNGEYKLNTGHATFEWLVKYCREASDVMLSEAA